MKTTNLRSPQPSRRVIRASIVISVADELAGVPPQTLRILRAQGPGSDPPATCGGSRRYAAVHPAPAPDPAADQAVSTARCAPGPRAGVPGREAGQSSFRGATRGVGGWSSAPSPLSSWTWCPGTRRPSVGLGVAVTAVAGPGRVRPGASSRVRSAPVCSSAVGSHRRDARARDRGRRSPVGRRGEGPAHRPARPGDALAFDTQGGQQRRAHHLVDV